MYTGLHRFELTRLAASSGHFRESPEKAAVARSLPGYLAVGFVGLLAVLIAGAVFTFSKWPPPSSHKAGVAASNGIPLATAAQESNHAATAPPAPEEASLYPAVASQEAGVMDGLKISSQRWRRGGLGSNALVSFTLRNTNDYAVKDIEISCAFSRRDGSHLTDRTKIVHETVKMKARKSFARWHIGFVNVNADRAKCTPVAATRI